ncbi:DUF1002 domain-containing protein [Vagococcus carniphilus]|uniref:DUF1002 domain-containing protein n=1 Tax=Vagococcus carniphilus TaxID=218144 RepID=A0A430AYV7_9ENTE|nr:DUF1002 domain-containing protein [Vagococcus carniphilus]QNN72023.1 DUF1002 domain-containing protein [Vagococcus carniphilus]RSU13243.1 hypothetical protein CBF28_10300 [Vagococcus carniphilus]
MKKIKLLSLSALLFAALGAGTISYADEKTKDEGWDVPNIALGNGLNESEKAKTNEILTKDLDKVPELKGTDVTKNNQFIVDGNDLVKYVTDVPEFTANSKAYSSALIARTKSGTGVNVEIVTPENITARTEAMYRSAAITSGVYDAYIRIASVRTMDGSGALAGIYKIYDEVDPAADGNDQKSRDEKREVAQEQMKVVSSIDEANQDKKDYSSENVLVMLADIQLELQKMNKKLDEMSQENKQQEVGKVVDKQIEKNGLTDVITPEQKTEIVNNMVSFTGTDAMTDSEMTKQLSGFKDDIMKNGKEFKDNLLSDENVEKAKTGISGVWQSVKDFFSNLFN